MNKTLLGASVLFGLLVIGFAGIAMGSCALDGDQPAIKASPSTIVLAKVSAITVHTNIPASTVEAGSLTLNGVTPTSVYVDNCGDIVAKFAIADLGLTPGKASLTLTGAYVDGGTFTAADDVTVK